jgi:hypothetical protein
VAVQFARVDEAVHCWEALQGTPLLPHCPAQLWFAAEPHPKVSQRQLHRTVSDTNSQW